MKFANLVIDRVDQGIFEKADGTIVGALNQVQNLTINTTTDPKDAVDARGVLIKRFYTAKNVELSAENAILNLDLAGLQFGQPKVEASSEPISSPTATVVSISFCAVSFCFNEISKPPTSSTPASIPDKAEVPVTLKGAETLTSADVIPEVIKAFISILSVTSVKLVAVTLIPLLSSNNFTYALE